MVRRLYVEKRPGFDVEAGHLLEDIRTSLAPQGLRGLRCFNRYDVEGLSDADYERAKTTIFSEPNVDFVYDETLPELSGCTVFATEYLPGQYDQRADSAAQCIQLLTSGEYPAVASARVIALEGEVSEEDAARIRAFVINPVESRLASMDKPATLAAELPVPEAIALVDGFCAMSDEAIASYHASMGFAMTAADLCFCRDYFREEEHRDPTLTELKVIDTYWSDHCRHTTFLTRLEEITVEDGELSGAIKKGLEQYLAARAEVYGEREKPITLMDMATIGAKVLKKRGLLDDLDESDEINACSIEAPVTVNGRRETYLIQFKNETHNHPTEIEPFGGAATCLGGAIRDPLSGRAYVYQAMRVTGSADPTRPFEETLEGKLPQKKITTGAAAGYSSYGNQIGLATGQVTELYDEGYVAKRMEIGAVVGASPKEQVVRECPQAGDVIVLLGGRTGRDGCGGATGSSKAHDVSSIETCGAEVQKGNPPTERKLQRLFRRPEVSAQIKRCNDFGAGGVCVAIGELADGLRIDLDKVPKKYDGLDGTELAISESQERMAVVLAPDSVDAFIAAAGEENLEATPVAVVTDDNRLQMRWRGDVIVDMSRDFLNTNGVTQTARAVLSAPKAGRPYRESAPAELDGLAIPQAFLQNLSRLNVCSQKGLSERFDSSIGAGTVLMPFAGRHQQTPEEAMVAKVPVLGGSTDDATAMSYGYIPAVTRECPYRGSAFAVMESLSKLAAVGADPLRARLTFQEYFERLYDRPERWGKPASALLGALSAQLGMGLPAIGGKDSMSGSFGELDVPPTLVSFALTMTKASQTGTAAFQKAGSRVSLIPMPTTGDGMPDYERARALYSALVPMIREGRILSSSVVKEGGAAACIAKMAFGNGFGFRFDTENAQTLFAPLSASFVVEAAGELPEEFGAVFLGQTTADGAFAFGGTLVSQSDALAAYSGKLEKVFAQDPGVRAAMPCDTPLSALRPGHAGAVHAAKPRVFIPVFPGTNCEYDTARAFERASGRAEVMVVRNLTPSDIEQTIDRMVRLINQSNIIMLPGGFSGGDEPDGSGKFIATTFRNPRVADAVQRLLQERDGLMLGICNGFQALIKLGLVPFGEIRDQSEDAPTLSFNTLGRHVSRMVYTRVTSVLSPWLAGCEAGEVHAIPVSHGEGRFVASDDWVRRLSEAGQIATQYVDLNGNPSDDIAFNPNGSVCAIEGITSPDGRIFGKMGHSERTDRDCYRNVPGEKDQKLFVSGIKYFQ